jgi:hypothetical protein
LLCSDAQEDKRLRDGLVKHLQGPALRGVTIWHDGKMPTGERHDEWRRQRLGEADLVVVLLSVDLLPLLDLFEEEVAGKGRPFLPVLLRKAGLDGTFFVGRKLACEDGGLAGRQGDAAKQEAYVEICEEVLRLLPDGEAGQGGDAAGGARGGEDQDGDDEGLERVLRRRLPLGDPEVLECDRTVQWDHLMAAAGRPGHEVLLLPGGSKQGHTFFLIRARLCLPIPRGQRQPPSVLGLPHYYPRPGHEADFLSALAESLRCAEDQVASRLRQRLQRGTLLVVPEEHRGSGGEDDGALVECLTSWLPRLLDQVGDVPYGLKWVHALSYYEAPAWAHLTARWLGGSPSPRIAIQAATGSRTDSAVPSGITGSRS